MCFLASGILAPVAGGSLLMVVFGHISKRVFWCEVLVVSQTIVSYLFFCTMVFGLVFRYVLIRYSSRGLVIRGKPELRLLHQLYWLIFWAVFCCIFFFYPIARIISGTFIDSRFAKMCLLHPLEVDDTFRMGRMATLCIPLLAETYNQLMSWRVRKVLARTCPKNTMASIGKYRRNLMTYKQTSVSVTCFLIYSFLQNFLLIIAASTSTLSPTALFWICNFFKIFFVEVLLCILLPLTLTIPWKHNKHTGQFYVRKTEGVLEPRRCVEGRQPGANKLSPANYTTEHVQPVNRGKYSYLSLGTSKLETRKLVVDPVNYVTIGKIRDGNYFYRRNIVQLATISD